MLQSSNVLVHYDPDKDVVLSCDANQHGVGAVLQHIMPDCTERPITFASRTLSPAEKNYSQLDKEGLGIVFGVKKFHQYVFGRHFTIYTDHKPLISLFGPTKATSEVLPPRIIRWSLSLSAYDYDIKYRPDSTISNADAMSRLPLPDTVFNPPAPGSVISLMEFLNDNPIDANQIQTYIRRDPLLSKVIHATGQEWCLLCDADPELY